MKVEVYKDLQQRIPERIVEAAVVGMLPKNSYGRELFRHLKVYKGAAHPHEAQTPEPLTFMTRSEPDSRARPPGRERDVLRDGLPTAQQFGISVVERCGRRLQVRRARRASGTYTSLRCYTLSPRPLTPAEPTGSACSGRTSRAPNTIPDNGSPTCVAFEHERRSWT